MKPIKFEEAICMLTKPDNMTDKECGQLPVWRDFAQAHCISCWRPSFRERLSILFNGRIWLRIKSGKTQPPVSLIGKKYIFTKAMGGSLLNMKGEK